MFLSVYTLSCDRCTLVIISLDGKTSYNTFIGYLTITTQTDNMHFHLLIEQLQINQ